MTKTVGKKSNLGLSTLPYHRIVVKLGTSLLTGGSDQLNEAIMSSLVRQVAQLHKQGVEPIIVSSGAIASGRYKLGLKRRTKDIPFKQVVVAAGEGAKAALSAYDYIINQR